MKKVEEIIEYVPPSERKKPNPDSLILDGDSVQIDAPSVEEFNWREAMEDGTVVVPDQGMIAVYQNPNAEIVVRQDGHSFQDNDRIIYVRPEYAERLCKAILALAKEIAG